ncbi:hypothetical protein [Methylophilus sp. 3sh_L]|uniref:hypothetical protein n=1 Tax=Methylophilus sp. 3sh_L TaxID=3377114 RepID=UPI00398EABF1
MHNQTHAVGKSVHDHPFIRDEAFDTCWQEKWTEATPAQRKQWLKETFPDRSATAFKNRSWESLYVDMRRDLITIMKRGISHHQPPMQAPAAMPASTQKPFWWQEQEKD